MIDKGPVTEDEMILAFLQADIETLDQDRKKWYAEAFAKRGADRTTLVHRGDAHDPQQNADRRFVLGVRGYGRNDALFKDFPGDTDWRLFKVTPDEVKRFKYANHQEGWARVSGSSRLVEDGVQNLYQEQGNSVRDNVLGIADRVRRGDPFPPLIAAQLTGLADEVVLMEGHTRATAYALTDLPNEIKMIIGTSAHMDDWVFF